MLKKNRITKFENITLIMQTPNVILHVSSAFKTSAPSSFNGLIIVVRKQMKNIPNLAPRHELIPYC